MCLCFRRFRYLSHVLKKATYIPRSRAVVCTAAGNFAPMYFNLICLGGIFLVFALAARFDS